MSKKDEAAHIAVHINELVLPRGSKMPDQAALRRLVEAELQRRQGASVGAGRAQPGKRGQASDNNDLPIDIANRVHAHMGGQS